MTLKLNSSTSGSVSIDAPASTTGGADVTFKLPVADGTSGQVLQSDGSGQLSFTGNGGSGRKVLEQFWSPCDGSVIALQDGNHTITDVTATQFATSSYVDCNGSSITYTPPSGTTQVVYEYRVVWGYTSASPICHFKILLDSDEVTSGRHIMADYTYPQGYRSVKWGFNIGGTADTAVGRVASWTSDKTIKVQFRRYASGQDSRIHNVQHWDGAGADLVIKPQLSITAIG